MPYSIVFALVLNAGIDSFPTLLPTRFVGTYGNDTPLSPVIIRKQPPQVQLGAPVLDLASNLAAPPAGFAYLDDIARVPLSGALRVAAVLERYAVMRSHRSSTPRQTPPARSPCPRRRGP